MRSPRFSFRENELKKIFTVSNLKATWKTKVRIALKKSPIPDPIDYLDFHIALDAECLKIERLIREGSYHPSPAKRILSEKSKGLCRQISIPALRDMIVLQRLSDALYADIKNEAPSKRAFFEPEDHKFSNIKKQDEGGLNYGSFAAWLNFQGKILQFTEEREYIIITDIANYYDSISYVHLRNVISSQINVREAVLDTLIYVLSGLLWQPDYMPRVDIGLPQINIDATRILAHCFLYELDEYLESMKYDFTRFMDDIDIGVDTQIQARHMLRDIDLILQTRQVRLNSGKTKILTREEAQIHFCVKENYIIDLAVKRIDRKIKLGKSLKAENRIIRKVFSRFYKGDRFDIGAGEKILKRMLSLARKTSTRIQYKDVAHILIKRPSCRDSAMTYLISQPLKNKGVKTIATFINSKNLVDDVSILNGSEAFVEANAPRNMLTDKYVSIISKNLYQRKSSIDVYALLWINSKYGNSLEILKYLRLTFDVWRADAVLGRLVGGMAPILRSGNLIGDLQKLMDNSRNPDAYEVFSFHHNLVHDVKNVSAIKSIISASNPTKPLGITHPKFLVLLSALQNVHLKDGQKIQLLKNHKAALQDKYYRHRIVRSLPPAIRSKIFDGSLNAPIKTSVGAATVANNNSPNIAVSPILAET